MGSTIIEKIITAHAPVDHVNPGDIVDVDIDARVARDFGGANVVKNIRENVLGIDDPEKTFFTFDCNPTGSDQKYAANQHICRIFARENGIRVFDINAGIGTHILIEEGLAYPGSTAVSTDSHANILGAVGAFGQGMGDRDIASAWSKGKIWFKVPPSARIEFKGEKPSGITPKDMVLNLLKKFGASSLLGYSVELYGDIIDDLTLDDRITIASMATEMGAIVILIPPNKEVLQFCESRSRRKLEPVFADPDAEYGIKEVIDLKGYSKLVSKPGKPHDVVSIPEEKVWIDSAFIGSCTNGRLRDIQAAACVLQGRKVAAHVVLKIVPATNKVWEQALEQGYIEILKNAGAMISNPGCAGCAAGQVGQNGPGEVTISSGNRNFPGKQGQGEVYLAAPDVVAASAVAGYITTPDNIPDKIPPRTFPKDESTKRKRGASGKVHQKDTVIRGRIWVIPQNDIDTDMIFHNRHLAITDRSLMGKYAFGNLRGYEDFSEKAQPGDIIITGKNFGAGSSRQQAVDCFAELGIAMIVAESFGAIYERNAINAAFPVMTCEGITGEGLKDGDIIEFDMKTGRITTENKRVIKATPFSDVQMDIYNNNGLF
ncbi:MAG: 3-isopropylmalate dehydratase large subunit [Bacteroidales bacterium]|nr:3-isopropylmalate dehydratase large subunit [Bacteroidales bacterium]